MASRVEFNTGANLWRGTSGAGHVLLYDDAGNPAIMADGAAVPAGQPAVVVGGVDHDSARALQVTREGGIEAGFRRLLLSETCEGATLNTQRWTSTATTMTAAQAATQITLNASAITTINTGILLTSRLGAYKLAEGVLHAAIRLRSTLVANQVGEWGLGQQATLSATAVAVDNGAFWRFTSAGSVVPCLAFNSTEITGTDIAGSLASTNYYNFHVVVEDDRAIFLCERSDTGATVSRQTLRLPITGQRLFSATHVNAFLRARNTGVAPASAGQLLISDVSIYQKGIQHAYPMPAQLAENAFNATVSPLVSGSPPQTAQFANSAAPASATLLNTAASYTTLGGLWQYAAVASAATDYCLFGFTVPSPYTLRIKGVNISTWNTVVANAATPATTLFWGLGINGASANLATGAHIRTGLGITSIPISAAIGAASQDLYRAFDVPLVCVSGSNLAVIMRVVGGAATATQVIAGHVGIDGFFE